MNVGAVPRDRLVAPLREVLRNRRGALHARSYDVWRWRPVPSREFLVWVGGHRGGQHGELTCFLAISAASNEPRLLTYEEAPLSFCRDDTAQYDVHAALGADATVLMISAGHGSAFSSQHAVFLSVGRRERTVVLPFHTWIEGEEP